MEDEKQLPVVEKQQEICGAAFKVISEAPQDRWKTGYAYWMHCKATGTQFRPMIGRYVEREGNDQFQVYGENGWEDAKFWDYSTPKKDKEGNILKNAYGKPATQPFFELKKLTELEFTEPIKATYYDKETKQSVVEEMTVAKVALSKSLWEKLKDQMDDPRNGENPRFKITRDPNKAPAEQYKVSYVAAE